MKFDPEYEIGQIVSNAEIVSRFACGNMGGMRRSHRTNTLVIVSDYTKGLYHDKWINGVLHYTGMGKTGNQDIQWSQNATLAKSSTNGVGVHLFEVMDPGEYIYCGRVMLVEEPYKEIQLGEEGKEREVWMFPVRPVPDNDVRKPEGLVFESMEDYRLHGKNADAEYDKLKLKKPKKRASSSGNTLKGKKINHKAYGTGTIAALKDGILTVNFAGDKKTLSYQLCLDNKLIEFI
ncbi:MAG: HNH endonuclease [bacterium]|nr:HNH endonuclease [bacterium]